jgi:hypothetical protein
MDPIVDLVKQLEPETLSPSEAARARQRAALVRVIAPKGASRPSRRRLVRGGAVRRRRGGRGSRRARRRAGRRSRFDKP